MKYHSSLFVTLSLILRISTYSHYKSSNPLIKNYTISKPKTIVQNSGGLATNILPKNLYPTASTNNNAATINTSVTTTEVKLPSATHHHGHSHPIPSFPPPPPAPPVIAHSHPSPYAPKPKPHHGIPHMHSGHPYIAPAVAPQRMTYQQIIEYLTNTNGANIQSALSNGSGNFLTKCKAYCDTLPPSPVCDSSNILYRNKCEAKCIHKEVSTTNLRYGICCCSDQDNTYSNTGNVLFGNGTNVNFCISTCILNCLGGQAAIQNEHTDEYNDFELVRSSTSCKNIN